MQRYTVGSPLCALVSGLWLLACGGVPDEERVPSGEPLGTEQSAMCADTSVSTLSLDGISSYQGLLAGSGQWAVTYPANAIRLEYYVDGVQTGVEERCDAKRTQDGTMYCSGSGAWNMSASNLSCGWHYVEVRAWPMIIDSANNRTTCLGSQRTLTASVLEYCPPTASLSCSRGGSVVFCSASANNGTGEYTPYWSEQRSSSGGGWYADDWDNSYVHCAPPGYGQPSEWLTIAFKVMDSNGVESNTQYAYFECALGDYQEY